MKITKLLNEYKAIAKQMKEETKNYTNLRRAVRLPGCTDKTFKAYNDSWKKLLTLNQLAYSVMCEYRKLAVSPMYRVFFALGIMPKQHGFVWEDDNKKVWFKYTQLLNIINP